MALYFEQQSTFEKYKTMKQIVFFANYLAAAAIATILIGLIYVTVQQAYRSGANDPQLEIARDMHERIGKGASVQQYLSDSINLRQSLRAFAALYNPQGQVMQSSGFLDGRLPQLPSGVFDFAKTTGQYLVTWQPRSGVRMATVILPVHSASVGYIVVGRSLGEVEIREHNLLIEVFVCWLMIMGIIAISALLKFNSNTKNLQ